MPRKIKVHNWVKRSPCPAAVNFFLDFLFILILSYSFEVFDKSISVDIMYFEFQDTCYGSPQTVVQ